MTSKLKVIRHHIAGDVMTATLILNGELFTIMKVGRKYRVVLCRLDTSGLIWRFNRQDLKAVGRQQKLNQALESEPLAELPICVYDWLTTEGNNV